MRIRLKPLSEQVVVITGASSGIGLVTARRAAARGAKLVLVSRNGEALEQLAQELRGQGADAIAVAADVGDEAQVRNVARTAVERFGGIDTWVNDAGVSIWGETMQVPLDEARRLFDTNFWGVVHGSVCAIEALRARGGGALINLGSEVSDVAIPLQGFYSASKHAVKGFTDALRVELAKAGTPISVTLIKPAAIDTMFVAHARNRMDVEPRLPPPVYAPEVVADAILHSAEHPVRDLYVGGGAKVYGTAARWAPRLTDRLLRAFTYDQQRTRRPARTMRHDALDSAGSALQEREGADTHVFEHSLYTQAAMRARTAGLVALAAGAALLAARGAAMRAQHGHGVRARRMP